MQGNTYLQVVPQALHQAHEVHGEVQLPKRQGKQH